MLIKLFKKIVNFLIVVQIIAIAFLLMLYLTTQILKVQ